MLYLFVFVCMCGTSTSDPLLYNAIHLFQMEIHCSAGVLMGFTRHFSSDSTHCAVWCLYQVWGDAASKFSHMQKFVEHAVSLAAKLDGAALEAGALASATRAPTTLMSSHVVLLSCALWTLLKNVALYWTRPNGGNNDWCFSALVWGSCGLPRLEPLL